MRFSTRPDYFLSECVGAERLKSRQLKQVRLSNLWLGDEGSSRDGEAAADRAEILGHDGETAPLSAACACCQSLDEGTEGGMNKDRVFF